MRASATWLLSILAGACCVEAHSVVVQIIGLDEQLEQAARAGLGLSSYHDRQITSSQLQWLLRRADGEIRESLEPYGYYGAEVAHHVETGGEAFEVTFRVSPGPPVRVTDLQVGVSCEPVPPPEVTHAIEAFVPGRGARLDHGQYEASKSAVSRALADTGYLQARLETHRVEVTRSRQAAVIRLSWVCGKRFRFGEAHFPNTPLSPRVLDRIVPWKVGEFYSSQKMQTFRQRLADADYFSFTSVTPQPEKSQDDLVPVYVDLHMAPRQILSGSLYGSTDTGAGGEFSYTQRRLNAEGHKLTLAGEYAQRLQSMSIEYRIPWAGAHERAMSVGTNWRDETTDTSEDRSVSFMFGGTKKWHGYTRTVRLQLLSGDFQIGSERGNSNELFAEATLDRSVVDDSVFARHGYSMLVGARLAPTTLVSATRFASIGGRIKWIGSPNERTRWILRASLGTMLVDHFDDLPPQLRFFAGGDTSIRGFDYQAVGSRNDAGDVIGGTHLAVVSAELEHYFGGKWGVALFADAGDAFRDAFQWNIGTGLGLRWRSPVGVLRLDFATPLVGQADDSFRIHFRIGSDL